MGKRFEHIKINASALLTLVRRHPLKKHLFALKNIHSDVHRRERNVPVTRESPQAQYLMV
jgi:hypothetical protein